MDSIHFARANRGTSFIICFYTIHVFFKHVFFSAKGHIVLLLFSAGPLDIKMAENYKVSAILHCFFPAQATGSALYNVITMKTNDSNPAGRLPFTWYSSQAQVGYCFYIVSLPLPFHDRLVPQTSLMQYSLNVTLHIFRDHKLEI